MRKGGGGARGGGGGVGGVLMKERMNERVRQGGGNASPAVLNT